MCSFYGWSIEYVENLPFSTFAEFQDAITVLEARDKTIELNVALYPKMSLGDRKKVFKSFKDLGHPRHLQKTMEFEDFFKKVKDG